MKKAFGMAAVLAAVVALGGCGGGTLNNVSVGGTVTGLSADGLILGNGNARVTVPAGATSFTFTNRINEGYSYAVFVQQQPTNQTCFLTNNSGYASNSDIKNITVTCVKNNILGGTVKNLTGTGLELNNGTDRVAVAPNGGADVPFAFATRVPDGFNYGVTILTQPAGQTCAVSNGIGKMGSEDTYTVLVTCQ